LKFGRNQIVSVEAHDGRLEVFTQDTDGNVFTQDIDTYYWVLSNEKLGQEWIRLKGDLHYCWGKKLATRQEYFMTRNRFKNKDLFTVYDPVEASLINQGVSYYKNITPSEVTLLSFDIETTGIQHDSESKVLLISNTFRKNGVTSRRLFAYSDYEDDGQMLSAWCEWVREIDPSIICGHNIYSYDFPYMQYVAAKYDRELILGRDDSKLHFENYESKFRKDATQFYHYHKVRIYGREVVDTMFLSIKYDVSRKYESYGLKSIIKQEGLEIEGRQFYDAGQIRYKYKDPEEWVKIKAYAEHDADDALALFDLQAPPFFYMNRSVPKRFQAIVETATGSQLNALMCRAYLQEGHSLPKGDEANGYEGAISFGNPGIYKNVFKVDVASLYPSIILTYDIYDKDKDPDAKFLQLVKFFTAERLKNKALAKTDKYYDDLQNAQKIMINSFYGFLGAPGLNFNSPKNAALITEKGRSILNRAIQWAKGENYEIVNADTDSISFTINTDEFDSKKTVTSLNSLFPSTINWEDDGLFKCIVVFKAKNYILYDGEKVKYKGSALKSSTKEIALKEFIQDMVHEMIHDTFRYQDVYNRYICEAMNITDMKRWASKKTITEKVLNPERTNEQKVLTAVEGLDVAEGDKIYVYFREDDTLGLAENFDGKYNRLRMAEKVYKTSKLFDAVIDPSTFVNYKLKKNQTVLQHVLENKLKSG
jgi:DNA polymerase elongation subunit (family B)